jgi:UDP-glucose 4-epimerase
MNVFIAGGFGFIGGRLSKKLHQTAEHRIIIGSRGDSRIVPWIENIKSTKISYSSKQNIKNILEGVDVVIYAAGMNAQSCSMGGIIEVDNDLARFDRFVEAASEVKVKRFIYLSSAHVYSNKLEGYFDEESNIGNQHPYAQLHIRSEKKLIERCRMGGMEGIIFRVSNVFGVPALMEVNCWHLVVNDLCRQVTINKEIRLKTAGIQKRDFISMQDVCIVIEKMIGSVIRSQVQIINLGSGVSRPVIEMATLIQRLTIVKNKYAPRIFLPEKRGSEIKTLEYSVDLLKSYGLYSNDHFMEELTNLLDSLEINLNIL